MNHSIMGLTMDELRLWIKDVGFPIVVAGIAIYALYKLFLMREQDAERFKATLQEHAEKVAEISAKNADASTKTADALGANTHATKELTKELRDKFGSDEIRRRQDEIVREIAAKVGCKIDSHAIDLLLKQHGKEKT